MRKFLPSILWIATLVSCNLPKSSGVINKGEAGEHPRYEHQSPNFEIPIVADYRFHPMEKKYFIDTDHSFLNYIGKRLNNKRPRVLYSAHTFVPPFYSTIGLLYLELHSDKSLNEEIKSQLAAQLTVTIRRIDTVSTSFGSAYRINYSVVNPNTQILTCYTEYFMDDENNLIRILFWTRECDEQAINEETEGIIKRIKFN